MLNRYRVPVVFQGSTASLLVCPTQGSTASVVVCPTLVATDSLLDFMLQGIRALTPA